jgi:hypothetical protein
LVAATPHFSDFPTVEFDPADKPELAPDFVLGEDLPLVTSKYFPLEANFLYGLAGRRRKN